MTYLRLILVLTVFALPACGNSSDTQPARDPKATATATEAIPPAEQAPQALPSGDNGADTPTPPPPSIETTCDEGAIDAKLQIATDGMLAYFSKLVPIVKSTGPCMDIAAKLVALEGDADKFVAAMMQFKSYMESQPDSCKEAAARIGETAKQKMLEAFPDAEKLDEYMRTLLKRCEDEPGFKEATQKGLRFMKKKTEP